MTKTRAIRIIRDLASQDCECEDRREAADARPGQQIAGWYAAAEQTGDDDVIDAIDFLGEDFAQGVYDTARAAV